MKIIARPPIEEFSKDEPMLANLIPTHGTLLNHLRENITATIAFLSELTSQQLAYRYAPGKWSIQEIIIHMIDMERIYAYRMLCIARGDETNFPGFNDEAYVKSSSVASRNIFSLLIEFSAVRDATVQLLSGLPDEALTKTGHINGSKVSVRALAYHIAGHELHHLNVIKARYLNPSVD